MDSNSQYYDMGSDILNRKVKELEQSLAHMQKMYGIMKSSMEDTLTVRDQFAMAALTGMLMRSVGYGETAEKAYKFADAMIEAREAK